MLTDTENTQSWLSCLIQTQLKTRTLHERPFQLGLSLQPVVGRVPWVLILHNFGVPWWFRVSNLRDQTRPWFCCRLIFWQYQQSLSYVNVEVFGCWCWVLSFRPEWCGCQESKVFLVCGFSWLGWLKWLELEHVRVWGVLGTWVRLFGRDWVRQ